MKSALLEVLWDNLFSFFVMGVGIYMIIAEMPIRNPSSFNGALLVFLAMHNISFRILRKRVNLIEDELDQVNADQLYSLKRETVANKLRKVNK